MESDEGEARGFDSETAVSVMTACCGLALIVFSIERAIETIVPIVRIVAAWRALHILPWQDGSLLGDDPRGTLRKYFVQEQLDCVRAVMSLTIAIVFLRVGMRIMRDGRRLRAVLRTSLVRGIGGGP